MTELEAGRAETLAPVRSGAALQRYRDVLIALVAFAVLASLPLFTGSKALLDFVIRCSAYRPVRDLAEPAGRLHRPDFVRPRHVLRPWRLQFWPDHAEAGRADSRGLRRDAGDHGGNRRRHRRDLRAAEGYLFRLRHARVSDADPLDHPVLGLLHRRRPGPAWRHSAPHIPRHQSCESHSSLCRELRASHPRPARDAPDRAIAVRLHVAHDPRQCRARKLPRHRRLAGPS
ncbi:hypothetical protein ACVW0J_007857 [Bradyrhizobium sp. i1.7.7]